MAACVHCIRPIYISLEAFLVSNGTQLSNGSVVNYNSALLTRMHIAFGKFHVCAQNLPIFANTNKEVVTVV